MFLNPFTLVISTFFTKDQAFFLSMICIPIPKSQVSVEFESFKKKAGKSWKNAAKKMMIWFLMVMSNVSDIDIGYKWHHN